MDVEAAKVREVLGKNEIGEVEEGGFLGVVDALLVGAEGEDEGLGVED